MLTRSAKCLQLDVRAFRSVHIPASCSARYGREACMMRFQPSFRSTWAATALLYALKTLTCASAFKRAGTGRSIWVRHHLRCWYCSMV